jgi:hypothetical protein
MVNKERIEKVLREVGGLESFLRERGVDKTYRVTALSLDRKSRLVGYALQGNIPTLSFPAGAIVAGVYRNGKFMEKYFASYPIVELSLDDEYNGKVGYYARLHGECINQNIQVLYFELDEMKGGEEN